MFIHFVSYQEGKDLIRDLLPDDLKDILGYKEFITIHLREIHDQSYQRIFYFAIEISHRCIFNRSLAKLIEEGYNPVGKDVRTRSVQLYMSVCYVRFLSISCICL